MADPVVAAYLVLAQQVKKRKKRMWWNRQLFAQRNLPQESFWSQLNADDRALFKNFTRMSLTDFHYLLTKLTPHISKQDTNYRNSIPASVRLLITLRFLASGDSYRSLMYLFKVSDSTISIIVPEVCGAILRVLKDVIKMPTTEQEWKKIAKDFEVTWNFPHCLGALDGKHVLMQCPANIGSSFYNYKGTFSIVLMAFADANYQFIYAHVGCQGRISDGGVFNATPFSSLLYEDKLSIPTPEPLPGRVTSTPYVVVADEAFPLKENIMKPYPGPLQHSPQRIFNYRLSRARRVVENTFGLLCSLFRLFRKPLCLDVKNAEVVVTACIYLHNFLLKSATSACIYAPPGTFNCETTDGLHIPGSWRAATIADKGLRNLSHIPRRTATSAIEIGDEFKSYFITDEGKVPWQERYQ